MAQYRHAQKASFASVLIKILIGVLIAAVIGGGAYAAYYFTSGGTQPATEAAVIQTEPTLQPPPTTAPTESLDEKYTELAKEYMNGMNEQEKICQMLIVTPESLTGVDKVTEAGDVTKQALQKYPVGGIIYFDDNLENADQTKSLIQSTQSYSKTPLFISVDEEGGSVARVANKLGTTKLEDMYTYKDQGNDVARNNATTIANDIKQFGFNLDFAPVSDIWSDTNNTVIGERAYSSDATQAAQLVASAVDGFHSAQMPCTLKHFPGLGNASSDPHDGSCTVSKSSDEMAESEFLPFVSGIKAGADMVMVGHAVADKIDPEYPASLSNQVVTDMLIGELGFKGVIITDSLQMTAVTDKYSTSEIAVNAINAGNNILLMPGDLKETVSAIVSAIKSGDIKQSQIEESVVKILALKFKYGIIPTSQQSVTSSTDDSTSPSTTATVAPAAESTTGTLETDEDVQLYSDDEESDASDIDEDA